MTGIVDTRTGKIIKKCDIFSSASVSDCDLERAALCERQARAQAEVGARRGQVDTISTRLSSLARLHKTLVSNHGHTRDSLDTLRQQLLAISKLVNSK